MGKDLSKKGSCMSSPKISIIIPVFNTEKYVKEAVESIMNQTLREIEIIIINDGSTDNSLEVVKELALSDARIRVHSQKNQGLSLSRNRGISLASGTYLYFMDSDDYLEPLALEMCYEACEKENLDFVFFDAAILNKEMLVARNLNYKRKDYVDFHQIYTGETVLNILIDKKGYTSSACLSVIRASYLKEVNLCFYPGIIHEDELFTFLLYLQARRVMCVPQEFFKRRFREDSIMTRRFSKKNIDGYFVVSDELLEYASNHPMAKFTIDKYLGKMLDAAVWEAHVLPVAERIYVARQCMLKYRKYIRIRTLAVLLLKSYIKN